MSGPGGLQEISAHLSISIDKKLKKVYNYLSWNRIILFWENVVLKLNNNNHKKFVIMKKGSITFEKKEWFGFCLTLLILFVGLMFVSFIVGRAYLRIDNEKYKMEVSIDSVKIENAALRQALATKMESLCDTMTIEQKLAQQKLDDYTFDMYEIKETQEIKAYELKENRETKAYVAMDHEKVQVIFTEYWEFRCQALLEIEKANAEIFKEYAATVFKHKNLGYNDYKAEQSLYEKLKKLEKNPLVAEYLSKEKEADAVRARKDSENEKQYQINISEIEKNYQAQLVTIEQNYNKKIAAKKEELGL